MASTAATFTLPLSPVAARAHSGASDLQWPHLRIGEKTVERAVTEEEEEKKQKKKRKKERNSHVPGSVELDEPHVFALHDCRIERAVRQLNHVGTFARALRAAFGSKRMTWWMHDIQNRTSTVKYIRSRTYCVFATIATVRLSPVTASAAAESIVHQSLEIREGLVDNALSGTLTCREIAKPVLNRTSCERTATIP